MLELRDVHSDRNVGADIYLYGRYCFNNDEHANHAIRAALYDHPPEKEVFGVYRKNYFAGMTGLWYEDIPALKEMAFIRWTGVKEEYRGQGIFKGFILEQLGQLAKANGRRALVEIAHTEPVRDIFMRMGFQRLDDEHSSDLCFLLGEDGGKYVLVKSFDEPVEWDWKEIDRLRLDKVYEGYRGY